ncbi:threonine aldolase [Aliikangiella marina]|uniref:Threonine aldolase n=1 Tax=Aliikangiella marina TaxID=1712262 RepID=A0A545TC43_9GAMM|nr:beta-eliminating lyase-related protein [Aliikangiella marina]TQV74795.1 threonine aldolase [Aliikangiella marina]
MLNSYRIENTSMRYLGMPDKSQQDWLQQLAKSAYINNEIDYYNEGELVQQLEARVAKILGKPSALFFTKGMVAQFSAFKAVEEMTGSNKLALHPLSHLAYDEADSYQALLGFSGLSLGKDKPFGLDELKSLKETPSIVSIELPLRRAGFLLPEWDSLCAMSQWCEKNKVHRHMDGARLWESVHYYQKTESEVAELFDSVYVSLYKGLGAMGGAILAGENDFIAQCKEWRTRFGGNSYTVFPFVISALDGLDNNHKNIPSYVLRAKQLAERLREFSQLKVPEPFTNGFFIFLSGDQEALNHKAQQLNEAMGLKLFNAVTKFPGSEQLMIEIQIGARHNEISDDEICDYFRQLLE